jgi:ornithine cyclodeaminase/alanine dehydrogenase-like protein (mu-crystallin family)
MSVLVLSDADVHAVLTPAGCEVAMTDVLRAHAAGRAFVPLRTVMAPPLAPGFMGLMPAHAVGSPGAFAVKAVCLMPANPQRGIDIHQGVVMLFDGEDGMPRAIVNAAAITEIRTAAVTAAATRALAVPGAAVLAVLGSGVQARAHLRALAGVRPWREVRIFSPTAARAQALAADGAQLMAAPDGTAPEVIAVAGAREAVQGADVLVTATSSREPVFEHAWLADLAHVNAVGASSPTGRELPVETVAAAALFCDSRESLRHEALEFRLAVEAGAITGDDHIRAELGEVLTGAEPGRTDTDGITLFRSLGLGIEDLAAAQLAVQQARERGLGSEVPL